MITRKTFLKRFFGGIEVKKAKKNQLPKSKKILIALDYYPNAQKVAEKGFSFAQNMKANITLLHVLTDPMNYKLSEHTPVMGFSGNPEPSEGLLEKIFELPKLVRQFLDKSKLFLGDDQIKTWLVEGDCAEAILKAANMMKADAIVMGSHSSKWYENTAMGSVTEKVLQNTTFPVLIIPTKKQGKS